MDVPTTTPGRQPLTGLDSKSVCPFCGTINDAPSTPDAPPEPCPRCTMENTAITRQATKARIGPWYVLQTRNPSAPGMKFATLIALIKKGQVTPRSILRGPTTHQFWRFAARVRGVSREFGLCYSCGGEIEPTSAACPHCRRSQQPPANPDALLEQRDTSQRVRATIHRQVPVDAPPTRATTNQPVASSAPQPTSENPSGHEPLERRGMTDEISDNLLAPTSSGKPSSTEILTPQQLAAVFQISAPKAPAETGASTKADAPPSHLVRNTFFTLILIALLAGGTWLYLDPDARQQTFRWGQDLYAKIKHLIQPSEGADTAPSDQQSSAPTTPTPVAAQPATPPGAQATPSQVATPQRAQPTAPSATPTPAPIPTPTVQKPSVTPAAPQMSHSDPDAVVVEARRLWRDAITSEGNGDYAQAVRLYEQIKQLPNYAWPSGVDLRLELARKQLKR